MNKCRLIEIVLKNLVSAVFGIRFVVQARYEYNSKLIFSEMIAQMLSPPQGNYVARYKAELRVIS